MTGVGILAVTLVLRLLGAAEAGDVRRPQSSELLVSDVAFIAINDSAGTCFLWGGQGVTRSVPHAPSQEVPNGADVATYAQAWSFNYSGARHGMRMLPVTIGVAYVESTGHPEGSAAGNDPWDFYRTIGWIAFGGRFGVYLPLWWSAGELARCEFGSLGEQSLAAYFRSLTSFRRRVAVSLLTEWAAFQTTVRPRNRGIDWAAARRCHQGGSCAAFVTFIASLDSGSGNPYTSDEPDG